MKTCFGRTPDDVEHGVAPVLRGGDVEERQLVGALLVIALRELHRVADVAKVLEVDPLDDPTVVDVEARDHPHGQAHRRTAANASSSVNAPV